MGKFIDPFTDWGFKRIFGQEMKGKGRMNARQILNVGFNTEGHDYIRGHTLPSGQPRVPLPG